MSDSLSALASNVGTPAAMGTEESPCRFDIPLMQQLFPFYVLTDENLLVQQLGPKAQRLTPSLDFGKGFLSVFRPVRPSRIQSSVDLRRHAEQPFLFESESGYRFRAQVLWREAEKGFLILMSPWVMGGKALESCGLTWLDFPVHDSSREYFHLARLQQDAMEDAERARLESDQQARILRSQMEAAGEGILAVDAEGACQTWNSQLLRMWNLNPLQLRHGLAQQCLEWISHQCVDPEECLSWILEHQGDAPPAKCEFEFEGFRIVEFHSAPVIGRAKQAIGRLWQFRDITKEREVERELERAKREAEESAQAKARFLAAMSHEIRSPLGAITGMVEMLLEDDLAEGQREMLDVVMKSAHHLIEVVNGVLDYSKNEAGEMQLDWQAVDLQSLLENSCSLSQGRKGNVELRYEMGEGTPPVIEADSLRLRQVLINLVSNALKFTREGSVVVRTRMLPGDWLEFSVEDTGEGMTDEVRLRLFRPFTQASASTARLHGGSGLGLAICRQLVELMGGEIWVDSEPGKGSRFAFVLPLRELSLH